MVIIESEEYVLKKATALKLPALLIAAVIIALSFAGCKNEPEDPHDQIIYYNIDNEPITLDPQIANDAGARLVILNIFEGLTRLDKDNNTIPGAAQSWDISTDRMMYTFDLRKDIRWNDNTPVTAQDFVFGIKRALAPETMSPTASSLFSIKNAEKYHSGAAEEDSLGIFALADDKLIIQLEYPDPTFLSVLSTPPAMPCSKSFFENTAGQYGRLDDKILSNGAFYVRENGWAHDEYICIRRNEYYKGENEVIPAGVNISIGKHYDNICSAIDTGETDCGSISSSEIEKAKASGLLLTSFGDTVWGITFNTQNEYLKNTALRRSLLSSLDRYKLNSFIPSGCSETTHIIPDSAQAEGKKYRAAAGDISFTPYPRPKQLLQEALKELGAASAPTITILCPDDEYSGKMANHMIECWNELTNGYFNKEPVSLSVLKDRVSEGSFEAVIVPLTIQGETPLSTLEMFESSSEFNPSALMDENYDSLIQNVRKNPATGTIDASRTAEQYLCDNAVFYPVFTENRFYASAGNVQNIIFHPYGAEADFIITKKISE